MNPQPPTHVGQIFAAIFGCMFLFYFIKEFFNQNNKTNSADLFTLGYIEEANNITVNVKNKTIKQIKQTKPSFESQQLYVDCIDALYSVGVKKSEAKKIAKQIFSSSDNPPKSVQDFLMIALRKN
jgi:Holliday junction resolvasome RuvABC DNA-binding subunit